MCCDDRLSPQPEAAAQIVPWTYFLEHPKHTLVNLDVLPLSLQKIVDLVYFLVMTPACLGQINWRVGRFFIVLEAFLGAQFALFSLLGYGLICDPNVMDQDLS